MSLPHFCGTISRMAKTPPPTRHTRASTLAVQLMLDTLRETCEDVRTHEQALAETRAIRNDYIRTVIEAGIPILRVAKLTGLGREQVYRINTSGEPVDPAELL